MKLHLPKKLTAALLAACAALALNTTAAAATTGTATFTGGTTYNKDAEIVDGLYLTSQMTTGTATSNTLDPAPAVNIWGGNLWAGSYTVSIWVTKDSLNSDQLLFAYAGSAATSDGYGANAIVWTKTGEGTGTLTIGRGKVNSGFTGMASWQNGKQTTGTITLGEDDDMVNFTFAVTGGSGDNGQKASLYVNGTSVGDVLSYNGQMNGSANPMNLYVSTAPTYGNVSITNEKLTTQAGIYALMGVTSVAPGTEKHFVWTGSTDGKWDTETANWVTTTAPEDPTTFESGDANTVTFGTEPSQKEVELSTTASVASVTVNDSYALSIANGGSLTTDALNITTGETTIAGEGSLTTGHLALSDNSSLKLSGTGAVSLSSMTFGSGSALKVARTLDLGTLALTSSDTPAIQVQDGGELTISTASTVDGNGMGASGEQSSPAFSNLFKGRAISVQEGGKLILQGNVNFNDSSVSGLGSMPLGLADLKVTGNVQINSYGNGCIWAVGDKSFAVGGNLWLTNKQQATVAGGSIEVGGSLQLAHSQNGTGGNYRAILSATDNSQVTLHDIMFYGGHNEVNINGSTLSFTKADGNVLSQAGNVPTAAADLNSVNLIDATLGALDHGWTLAPIDSATVTVSGTTNLSVADGCEINLTASSINGTFKMKGDGKASISGVGALTGTVDSGENGTIVLNGTYEIGGITPTGGETTYSGGKNEKNGYETAKGQIVAYTGNIEDHASYTYHGESVMLTEGAYSLPGVMDPTTFYINELSESYSWIDEKKTEDFSGIVVKSGAALVVDKAMDLSVVAEASTGNVQIESGIVATGTSDGHVTLTGSGVYALTDGTVTLGNVTLGSEWTGTVRIHDAAVNNVDFKTLVNGTDSTLELMGYSGYPMAWYEQVEGGLNPQNIKLTNGSDGYAFKYTGSTSYDNHVVTFSGNWSGDGTMQTAGNHLNYKFTGDISDWNGKLQVASGIPHITFSGDADEVNAIIDKNGKTLDLIVGEGTAFSTTFKATVDATSLTVSGNASASLEADATIGSVTSDGHLTMAAGTTVTLSNNLTPMSGTVDVYGTLNVSNDIDLSKNGAATGTLSLKAGSETTAAGMWMASGASLLMEQGAVLNIAGLQIVGTGEGSIATIADNGEYGADNADFTITNAGITATADVTIANTLTGVTVDTGAHAVTLNSDADSVTVRNGGIINKGEGGSISNLTVEDGGTIGEGIEATEAKIAKDATIFVEESISDLDADVYVYSFVGDTTVTNLGNDAAKYEGLQDSNMKVSADTLYAANEDAYVVNNELEVGVIMHEGTGALTLTKVDGETLEAVSTDSAALTLKGITETSLTDLSIGTGATVAVYTDTQATLEGTVTISDTLTAGGATLLANLTIVGNEQGTTTWELGGAAMTLGSKLTLDTTTSLINLDAATIAALEDLSVGGRLDFITAAQDSTLTYGGEGYEGMWYDGLFVRTEGVHGDYRVYASETSFGLTKVSNVPEPTTGTLSLLALMALAARRRRK